MKRLLVVAEATAIAALTVAVVGQTPRDVNRVSDFMRLKLDHSKSVLEGLAVEDYEMIAKHGSAMALLSHEASWQVLQTEEYLQHSAEFRRTANALTKAAEDENLDGAALAYVELTMKCVNCHKYVRNVRMARFQPHEPMSPIAR